MLQMRSTMLLRHVEAAGLAHRHVVEGSRHLRATELLPCAARSSTPNGGLQGVAQVLPVLTRRIPQTQTGTVAMSRFCGSSLGRSAGQRSRRDQSSRGGGTAMTTRSFSLPVTAASLTEPAAQATEWIPFVLSPESIEEGCQQTGLLRTKYLTSLLKHFTALARPPISNFRVAAIGLGASGRAYAGVNLEIPGLPLHNSVHAEQFVVANAMQHGETRIQQMLVNHPPCGHCRQFLQELRGAEDISVVIADQHAETSTLHHFLPHPFGPRDLLHQNFPLLLEPQNNALSLLTSKEASTSRHPSASASGAAHSAMENGAGAGSTPSELVEAALAAAKASYAPYSCSPSGVALKMRSGQIFSGSYMESAAYNPSLPPLQAAMVAVVSQCNGAFSDIVEAALVELPDAQVQFADITAISVQKLSPGARFEAKHSVL